MHVCMNAFEHFEVNSLNSKIKMCSEFINKLNYEKHFFKPALEGITDAGNKLQLGFSCYGLKFFYLSGQWESLSGSEKTNWTNTINSFQTEDSKFPQNSYVDTLRICFCTTRN